MYTASGALSDLVVCSGSHGHGSGIGVNGLGTAMRSYLGVPSSGVGMAANTSFVVGSGTVAALNVLFAGVAEVTV